MTDRKPTSQLAHAQPYRHDRIVAILALIWFAAGLTWFLWRGWQAVQAPGPYAGPGYLAWLQNVPQLTPLRLALLAGVAGAGLWLGWLVWRTSRFDRFFVGALAVLALGLIALRPVETVAASMGRCTLRHLGVAGTTLAEDLFYSLALGWGWLILIGLVLGFLGLLSPLALWVVLVLLAVVSWRDGLAWWQALRRWRPSLPAGSARRLFGLAKPARWPIFRRITARCGRPTWSC